MRGSTIGRWLLAAVLVAGVLAGCSDDGDDGAGGGGDGSTDDSTDDSTAAPEEVLEGAAFVEPGPYAAGVT
ncbi:hypothetical protein B7486_74205, partial [cyanobacterium TDX16]